MDDIAPELLDRLRRIFLENLSDDARASELPDLLKAGKAGYEEAGEYAEAVGRALADAFSTMTGKDLPDGKMYWNIADRVIRPLLEEDHAMVCDVTQQLQKALNEAAGIGLKPQTVPVDKDKIDGILNRLDAAQFYDDVAWILSEPVVTYSRGVVDSVLKANVDFQGKSGLAPKVIRKASYRCCEWCSRLAGSYTYPDVPLDVYRRHGNCRCVVEFDPGTGKRQNVHTKQWTEPAEAVIMEERKTVGLEPETRQFQTEAMLQRHFTKHQSEYGTISIPEYLRQATGLADAPLSDDVVQLLRSDGSIAKYRFSTNDFLVINEDGTIRTFFRPEKKEAYWQYELDRN